LAVVKVEKPEIQLVKMDSAGFVRLFRRGYPNTDLFLPRKIQHAQEIVLPTSGICTIVTEFHLFDNSYRNQ